MQDLSSETEEDLQALLHLGCNRSDTLAQEDHVCKSVLLSSEVF